MIQVRKSEERGHANQGWLDSYHTFSFATYQDPRFQGFHDLLVINEDRIDPATGFGTHGHRDMEIITYVLEGELEHKDSMGTGSVLRYGDVQRMSAGKGVRHSEFNHSKEKPLHLFQIWITPGKEGLPPSYEEKRFSSEEKQDQLKLVVSPQGENGSIKINQDALLYASILEEGKTVDFSLRSGRKGWIQMARGEIDVNGIRMKAGDGAAIENEQEIRFLAKSPAEFLVFDLP